MDREVYCACPYFARPRHGPCCRLTRLRGPVSVWRRAARVAFGKLFISCFPFWFCFVCLKFIRNTNILVRRLYTISRRRSTTRCRSTARAYRPVAPTALCARQVCARVRLGQSWLPPFVVLVFASLAFILLFITLLVMAFSFSFSDLIIILIKPFIPSTLCTPRNEPRACPYFARLRHGPCCRLTRLRGHVSVWRRAARFAFGILFISCFPFWFCFVLFV